MGTGLWGSHGNHVPDKHKLGVPLNDTIYRAAAVMLYIYMYM